MVSRIIVIVLAFGMAIYRASHGAWIESGGLAALAAGLLVLRIAERRRGLRPLAYVCFALTAAAMVVSFLRQQQGWAP